jgi:hypothetical protein
MRCVVVVLGEIGIGIPGELRSDVPESGLAFGAVSELGRPRGLSSGGRFLGGCFCVGAGEDEVADEVERLVGFVSEDAVAGVGEELEP